MAIAGAVITVAVVLNAAQAKAPSRRILKEAEA
jgi:hypothetical protein